MPVTVSYPGVYVQEIASGQQTIGGVATSITAFAGRTYRGPVNIATSITSFAAFQRQFGGLMNNYPLTFAVRDFFQNGGTQAIIVRIYGPSWVDFPLNAEQQELAAGAASTVFNSIGIQTASSGVTTAVTAAAAQFAGSNFPEQTAAANWLVAQASAWSGAVGQASITPATLNTYLGQVAAVMNGAAQAVVDAIESPLSYPTIPFPSNEQTVPTSPPSPPASPLASPEYLYPDATSVVNAAMNAAAAEISGIAQDAAYLVANAIQLAYADYDLNGGVFDPTGAQMFFTLAQAGSDAVDDIGTGLNALQGVPATTAGLTSDQYLQSVVYEITSAGTGVAENAAFIAANALLAQVLPAFQLDTIPPQGSSAPLGELYLQQLTTIGASSGNEVSPVVAATVPATTATIVVQVPQNFVAVAQAANSVAQAAWLAAFAQEGQSNATSAGSAVWQAATEAASQVTQLNTGVPAVAQAAQAVATAVATQVMNGAAASAAEGSKAVYTAVASALQLPTSNGAIVALQSAELVAAAAWGGTTSTAGFNTIIAAAPSRVAAQDAYNLLGLSGWSDGTPVDQQESQLVKFSNGLVGAVVQALPTLTLYAANAGEWANGSLTVGFNNNGITAAVVQSLNLTPAPGNAPFGTGDLFNLVVGYTAPDGSTLSESWMTVSLRQDAGAQRIDRVLSNSILLQYFWPGYTANSTYPTSAPPPLPVPGAYGVAGQPSMPLPNLYGTPLTPNSPQMDAVEAAAALLGTPSAGLELDDFLGNQSAHTGIYALDLVDQFDLLCIPPDTQIDTLPPAIPPQDPDDQWRLELYQTAAVYCQSKLAMLILDPPTSWAIEVQAGNIANISITDLGTYGPEGEYAAVYFPYLIEGNPMLNGQLGYFAPSGAIAGIMSRTDAARGVWKAPAGINDGAISGTQGLELKLSDSDNGLLNPQGINCLRTFPVYGNVVWGARTLKGADVLNSDYKYVPVRRLALYIEASLKRGLQWAVFEPNAEPLWSGIRLSVGSFMNTLYRQGAFSGTTAKDAYFVACDATTTTPADIAQGIVNVTVGFAPLLPAEFVVITIQQMAGQTPT